jgi:tungstate transport system substrate-binding protein
VNPRPRLGVWALALALAATGGVSGCERGETIVVATTTSLEDSGLLDALRPAFQARDGSRLRVVAVGSGEALALGARRDADVVLAHAPAAESAFVAAGHAAARVPVLRSDFLLVGPAGDAAGGGGGAGGAATGAGAAAAALARIAADGHPFVSRGDDSGTHQRELELWRAAGRDRAGLQREEWYLEVGQGMAEALRIAAERGAYLLTDRATWLAGGFPERLAAVAAVDPALENVYSVLVVRGGAREAAARRFAAWLAGAEARALIAAFGAERFGAPLFEPVPAAAAGPGS